MSQNLFTLIFKFLAGIVATLIVFELGLRALPVYDVTRLSDGGELTHLTPNGTYTYSKGWRFLNARRGVINKQGFNATYDYQPLGHDVAVIGDSFMQALMLDPDDTLAAHMGTTERPALVLADGGYNLADYLVASRVATERYGVRKLAILMVNGDVDEAFTDSYRGKNAFSLTSDGIEQRKSTRRLSNRERRLQWLSQNSRLAGYLGQNLVLQVQLPRMFKEIASRFRSSPPAPNDEAHADRYRQATAFFLQRLVADTGLAPSDIVLLFDADRPSIYQHESPILDPREERFKREASHAGFNVVDLNVVFGDDYKQHARRFDFSPEDGHWNEYGHYLAARSALDLLATGTAP